MAKELHKTMRDDFATILGEIGNEVTITRTTPTKGSVGDVTGTTEESYTIRCVLRPIKESDRDIHSSGLAEPGDRIAAFKHEYGPDDDEDISTTFTPRKGDIIEDSDGEKWIIKEIMAKPRQKDNVVYIRTLVNRME